MKSILITGGAGFIGSRLVKKLHDFGYKLIVVDSLDRQIHGDDPVKTSATYSQIVDVCEFHHGDVRNRPLMRQLLAKTDALIHLAAATGTGQSMYAISDYCDVNIQGTAVLMEEVLHAGRKLKKIVVASSRAVYGEGKYSCSIHGLIYPTNRKEENLLRGKFDPLCPHCGGNLRAVPTDENSPAMPQSIYGITKWAQEQLVLRTAASASIPAVALRFQNVFGPGQALSNPYTGILSIFSTRARQHKSINIFEDGLESRDFVYIDDVVASIKLSLESQENGQIALNVGSGVSTDVNTVVSHIVKFFDSASKVEITGQFRVGDIRHNMADLELTKNTLGFQPQVPFGEGIKRFLSWAVQQENIKDEYEKSLSELRERGMLK